MAENNFQKQLRIKTGALRRTHKEYLAYVAETDQHQAKVDQLAADPDVYKLKTQVNSCSFFFF